MIEKLVDVINNLNIYDFIVILLLKKVKNVVVVKFEWCVGDFWIVNVCM